MRVAVLGATGMLGHEVAHAFAKQDFDLLLSCRDLGELAKDLPATKVHLDVNTVNVSDLEKMLRDVDWCVNCIGIIKPYIREDDLAQLQKVIHAHNLFPTRLAEAAQKTATRVIQIATDCVWDGAQGNYIETDSHNATDIYGKTKSIGEIRVDGFYNIRCSIIGHEAKNFLSLLEWFLRQGKNAKVRGFENHLWNGVTTRHFAKLCLGIIKSGAPLKTIQHFIPEDIVSKFELLKMIAEIYARHDMEIIPVHTEISIDRSLNTIDPSHNSSLWKIAGYEKIPSVRQMLEELQKYH